MGQTGLPHRSFAPRHSRHIHAGGFSITSMDRAVSSWRPVVSTGMTFESQVILFGSALSVYGKNANGLKALLSSFLRLRHDAQHRLPYSTPQHGTPRKQQRG